ncbi:nudix hydrolase domain protein [Faustovirus]|nr:hypothetical protein F-LCD7_0451 [Faustovirus]QJX72218.1 hypothetical protein F-M6_0455 [Faustovirus]QJX72713.1 nudix hydrolase domain protein [Faustovirus]QJX73210.1 hypothetical protein F-VV57_0449 [Faustovirus]QJX73717.1 hypothetical protein F-VV63_0451 [Faustovirus]
MEITIPAILKNPRVISIIVLVLILIAIYVYYRKGAFSTGKKKKSKSTTGGKAGADNPDTDDVDELIRQIDEAQDD